MRVAVIGLGYVGCVSAACLALAGHDIVGLDIDQDRVDAINRGESPLAEPGLERAIGIAVDAGMLRAECGVASDDCELSLVCVGTPRAANGHQDLRALTGALEDLGSNLRGDSDRHVVAIRSTVLPGLFATLLAPTLEEASRRRLNEGFGLCASPEFLREGSALADFAAPAFTLIGESDRSSGDRLAALFKHLPGPQLRTDPDTAMMVKYACNAFHAAKVSFANEVGNICRRAKLDGRQVMSILASDHQLNLSPAYLKPGFSYGGSCLSKDLSALLSMARNQGLATPMLSALERSNDHQFGLGLEMALASGGHRIGLVGLSFKAGSGDLRESPLNKLGGELLRRGADVRVYDPDLAQPLDRSHRACKGDSASDLCHLLVPSLDALIDWAEVLIFGKAIEIQAGLKERLRHKRALIDLANLGDGVARFSNYRGICW